MISKIFSGAIVGLESFLVEIETTITRGLNRFTIVGLPDKTVEEAKERVSAVLKNLGYCSPYSRAQKILINLAPADLKKEGALYDLPIALGYLLASSQIFFDHSKKLFAGELSLIGELRPIKGALALALLARTLHFDEIILPYENAKEASVSYLLDTQPPLKIIGVKHLKEAINHLTKKKNAPSFNPPEINNFILQDWELNVSWIKGQELAKRALEIAAAGGHNLLMIGPPGTGKTLLAKSMSSLLPPLNEEEIMELTKIYSVAGLLSKENFLVVKRPFRAPHHSASKISLLGGGNPPKIGEITLAHRGVLFLDELPEFHRDVLEGLRQPLEEGKISVLRAGYRLEFPSRFTLISASNPCPCGYYQDSEKECHCSPSQIQKYQRKLSGPLADRIDLFINVEQIKYEKLISSSGGDQFLKIKENVKKAREIQKQRFFKANKLGIFTNSEMGLAEIKKYCPIEDSSHSLLRRYLDSRILSVRGYYKVLKIARTIADLEGSENILSRHLSEALMYRARNFGNLF
jgi:magnesium chelatase family protein